MPESVPMRKPLVAISIFLLGGCSLVYAHLTYDFVALPENKQILYEAGAQDLAKLAAAELAISIDKVEKLQFVPFKNRGAIKIYVFNDKNHYANFSNASVLTRGSSTTDEVYLSEKLRERIDTLPSILVHELSHVHIRQHVGTFKYLTNIPGWFLEGVAVAVSSGGGAENVTQAQGQASIRNAVRFAPDDSGRIIGHRTAHNYGLEPQMYYRQASLFVEYLQKSNASAFEGSLVDIVNGVSFREVWPKHYGHTISELWRSFERSIGA
jgi:hypothetical protein